jgi:hypothetical protein
VLISRAFLSDKPIVFGVCPDPEPTDTVGHFYAESTVAQPNSHGAESSDRLELKGWMLGIRLQQLEVLVREFPNITR